MASTPVQPTVTKVDPMFSIPDGVTELEYDIKTEGVLTTGISAPATDESEYVQTGNLDGMVENVSDFVEVPEITTVVSQTLRRSPGGSNVIDIVIDVTDVAGAVRYETRVAKI